MTVNAESCALIVAHGQPSAPDGPEADIASLALKVGSLLPGWRVEGATLAAPDALKNKLDCLPGEPLIYPLFMADGWFVSKQLPKRLREAGHADCPVLKPLGLDPALPDLMIRRAEEATGNPGKTTLLLAAHGSQAGPRAGAVARQVAGIIEASGRFLQVRTGFVEEEPFLADAAKLTGPAVCLPFFASRNGHVLEDVPEAMEQAGFTGPTLPPIGTDTHIPKLIADSLRAAKTV